LCATQLNPIKNYMTAEKEDIFYRYRVGLGYDSHRFAEKRKLVLGGVIIDYPRGLLGHSDGDAALHALMDGLLGAAGLPDIGQQFPPSDPQYKDADSYQLLLEAAKKVGRQGFNVVNVDITIITEEPQITPYAELMRKRICQALDLELERVAVKGKSNEGMGFIGRGEGIAALASVLLFRCED
jgi:2-C-methyl-D-erythritol 2,4-cyclodiphosphate synthase